MNINYFFDVKAYKKVWFPVFFFNSLTYLFIDMLYLWLYFFYISFFAFQFFYYLCSRLAKRKLRGARCLSWLR